MILSAEPTRKEIICRLREISSSPNQAIDAQDSLKTCDFFRDDLAFDPPYTSMVGLILYPGEVQQFVSFMTDLNAVCSSRIEGGIKNYADLMPDLRNSSLELLQTMLENDNSQ